MTNCDAPVAILLRFWRSDPWSSVCAPIVAPPSGILDGNLGAKPFKSYFELKEGECQCNSGGCECRGGPSYDYMDWASVGVRSALSVQKTLCWMYLLFYSWFTGSSGITFAVEEFFCSSNRMLHVGTGVNSTIKARIDQLWIHVTWFCRLCSWRENNSRTWGWNVLWKNLWRFDFDTSQQVLNSVQIHISS